MRRKVMLAAPALVAGGLVLVGAHGLERLARDPGAVVLVRWLAVASWLAPLAVALVAARFNQSRLVLASLGLAALGASLDADSLALEGPGAPALLATVPLATALITRLDERGVATSVGLRRVALLALLLALPAHFAAARPDDLARALERLGPVAQPTPGTGLPWTVVAAGAVALAIAARTRGRDGDVVGSSVTATGACAAAAITLAAGSIVDASPLAAPVLLLGATATVALGVHVVAWRRGYVDDLTGLHGRRALDEALDRLEGAYAIAVVDVDHFKRFNDEHGHDAGDDALRLVAGVLAEVRGGTAYRQGGEEFVILFPRTSLADAAHALDALRESVEQAPLRVRSRGGRSRVLRVTASLGVAERSPRNASARETLRAADQALLRAKRLGRNRVEIERRRSPEAERRARGPRISRRSARVRRLAR